MALPEQHREDAETTVDAILSFAQVYGAEAACELLAVAHMELAAKTPLGSAVRMTYESIGVDIPAPANKPTIN